jgi:hypothetical protein
MPDNIFHSKSPQMPDNINLDPAILARIPDADREAVHAALRATIERELIAKSGIAAAGCEHNKEAGPLHSKDFQKCNKDLLDNALVEKVSTLDDAQHAKFLERLSQLRGRGI